MAKNNELWYYQVTYAAAIQEAAEKVGKPRRRALALAVFAQRSARQLGYAVA